MIINKIDTQKLGLKSEIDLRVLREDLYPFFGGGNKARKLKKILYDIKTHDKNAVVTTGSIYSNHCRAVALMCSNNGLALTLVLHGNKNQFEKIKGNAEIIKVIKPKIIFCEVEMISKTMEYEIEQFKDHGMKPYYLQGGGHNKEGVESYIEVVLELNQYFKEIKWKPDYIFLPSGTGSTQAGLVLGTIKYKMDWKIIGISIARTKEKGVGAIFNAFDWFKDELNVVKSQVIFDDSFLAGGYGIYNKEILDLSLRILKSDGLFLDPIYTAKGMWGTFQYIKINNIKGNILFMNTGGYFNFITN